MKRSGFTMIELIFVIVILGILAAVAIPKLAATRDDAKVATVVTQAKSILNEVSSYVTAQKAYDKNISLMSPSAANLETDGNPVTLDAAAGGGKIVINDLRSTGSSACITITLVSSGTSWTTDFDDFDKEKNITITHAANTNAGCPNIQDKVSVGTSVVKGRSAKF